MTSRDRELLQRISEYCSRIEDYCRQIGRDKEQFLITPMVQDACCMCIVQIGELSGLLSDDFRQTSVEIPWRAIKGTRNFYVHNYGKVDLNYVWDAVVYDIPELHKWCDAHK